MDLTSLQSEDAVMQALTGARITQAIINRRGGHTPTVSIEFRLEDGSVLHIREALSSAVEFTKRLSYTKPPPIRINVESPNVSTSWGRM
jgi:hypothetical protein